MKFKNIISVALACTLMFSLVGCSSKNEKTTAKDSVNIGMLADPDSLNPLISLDGGAGSWFSGLTYPTLLGQDEDANIIPYTSEKAETSEDGLTVTYHLRKDLKWSDGTPFTSTDVAFTKSLAGDQGLSPLMASPLALVESVNTPDEYTVEFKLKQPSYSFVNSVGIRLKIVPKHIWEKIEEPANYLNDKDQVAMGPYKLSEFKKGEYYTYEAVENWFETPEKFDAKKLVFRIYPDANALTLALENGEIDIIGASLPADLINGLAEKGYKKVETSSLGFVHVGFNLNNGVLSDVNIRKAIAMAIDKETLLQFAVKGQGEVMESIISPAFKDLISEDENTKFPIYSAESAKELLKNAGYSDTDGDGILNTPNGENVSFKIMIIANDSAISNGADVVKKCLSEVGIDMEIESIERSTFIQRRLSKEFDAYLANWGTMEPMLGDFILNYLSSSPVYFNGVKCDSIENSVVGMQCAKNEDELKTAIYDFQVAMADHCINVPLYTQKLFYVYNPEKIVNLKAYPTTMRGVTCREAFFGLEYK